MQDELGERMKTQYEHRTRFSLPRRTYILIRLDGKAFHTYTRNLKKPFDDDLIEDTDKAIIQMLPQIQGAVFAYTQSDEISILLTDFESPTTNAWFDNNLQKMCSVSASLITAHFNKFRAKRWGQSLRVSIFLDKHGTNEDIPDIESFELAFFDSRVFTIPDPTEVMNYFIWRNQDIGRNSVSMVAQSLFSHKELQGKSSPEMQEMMFQQHGINWANYDQSKKNGRLIVKEDYYTVVSNNHYDGDVKRTRWISKPAWKFTEDKESLKKLIPKYE